MSQTAPEHLALTQAFIDEHPVTVAWMRRPKTATGTGGWTYGTAASLGNRTVRVVARTPKENDESVNETGQLVTITKVVIAMPTDDIAAGDQFSYEGRVHEIVTVRRSPAWRIHCEVTEHAA